MKLYEFTVGPIDNQPKVLALSQEPDATEPAVPPNAQVQEILFTPPTSNKPTPGNSIVMSFVMSKPHIEIRMRRAVRTFYAIYGTPGLDSLLDALVGNPKQPWTLKGQPYMFYRAPYGSGRIEEDQRYQLRTHFIDARARLFHLLEDTRAKVVEAATTIGLERLEQSKTEVLNETRRYIGLASESDETTAAALDSRTLALPLTGPDILPLATALLRLEEARGPIERAEKQYDRLVKPRAAQRAAFMKPKLEALSEEDIRQQSNMIDIASQAVAAYPDTEEVIRAQEVIAEREAEFFALVAAEAVGFPILHRIADMQAAAQEIRRVVAGQGLTNSRQVQRALTNSIELRTTILSTLRTTWDAAKRTQKQLEDNDLVIWRYPPLVTAALRRLAVPEGTVEWRAANEEVKNQEDSISLLSSLSTLAGFFEMGVVVAGAAPPVAAAAAVISLLLQAAEWLVSLWETLEERDAFNSSLNPARSFASEPSYVGVLVGLAFLGLSARDFGKTVGKLTHPSVISP